MTIGNDFKSRPVLPPSSRIQFVEKTLYLSGPSLQQMQQIVDAVNGLTPVVACNATNSGNLISLTPLIIAPKIKGYFSFTGFAFTSPVTTTGTVTANVITPEGTLDTLPVYINHGASAAGSGALTIDLFYIFYFVDTLNSGNGGFVVY